MEPRALCPVRFEFSPSRVRFVGVAAQMHLSSLKFRNQIPKALSGGKEVSETATERETEAKARLAGGGGGNKMDRFLAAPRLSRGSFSLCSLETRGSGRNLGTFCFGQSWC